MSEAANGPAALEAELDALYGAPLAEFIARRDALAKRLKSGGDAEGSRRVKALRKPSVVAWAINRLHLDSAESARSQEGQRGRGHGDAGLAPLQAASEALRTVLRESRSAEERRGAIEARRRALESVSTAVVALLAESETAVTPALLRRIEGTLLALASAGGVAGASAPSPGRLDQELEPPGFEAIQDFPAPSVAPVITPATSEPAAPRRSGAPAPASGPTKAGTARPARASSKGAARSRPSPAQPTRTAPASGGPETGSQKPYVPTRDRKREAAIAAAQRAADDSEAALERATTKAEAARDRADQAEQALERARREVEAARRELVAARTALSESRRELDRLRRSNG